MLSCRVLTWAFLVLSADAAARGAPAPSPDAAGDDDLVAASVDGQPVFVREVRRELERMLGPRHASPESTALLRAQALEQVIDRRLVLRRLDRRKLGASGQDVDLAVERLRDQLQRREQTLEQYLQRVGMSEDELRLDLAWRIGWRRYLDEHLTEENLQRYFDSHRREFDGAQVGVAHILFKVAPPGSQPALARTLDQAARIRDRIERGELTLAEAARRYSQAPSAAEGGRLGFISRHEPMPETFSRAAFDLEAGEISQPIVTAFGVHLIQCQEIRPGDKEAKDVREELATAAAEYLFRWLADQERPSATITFTGAAPHFKPGGKELADEQRDVSP